MGGFFRMYTIYTIRVNITPKLNVHFGSWAVSKISLYFVNRCNQRLYSLLRTEADYV